MKFKNALMLNIRITKLLIKASPGYMLMNIMEPIINSLSILLQILFFQKLIDFIIYRTPQIQKVAIYFFLYIAFYSTARIFTYWVTCKFNEQEKAKVCLYYKNLIYNKSAKIKRDYYNSQEYLNKLHYAIYNEGTNIFSFTESVCSLLSAIISFCSAIYLFGKMHIILIIGTIFASVKNCVLVSEENKISYNIHKQNLAFDRCDTYIRDLFYKKQYVREFKLYRIGDYFIEKYSMLKELYWKKNRSSSLKKGGVRLVKETIDLIIHIFNIVVVVNLLINQKITVGEFNVVLSNFTMLAAYIEGMFMFIPRICNNANYVSDILEVIDCKEGGFHEVKHSEQNLDPSTNPAFIRCEHLSFSYDGQKEILKDICIELPLDKRVAIVGENGSGKSTFIKLLLGLYMPSKGEIKYFYPDISIETSRDLFSTLLQDYKIFPLSIEENISMDAETKDITRLEAALRFAGLEDKVNQLPDGIHTVLTGEFLEGGVSFSGGEQQKLAIARTFTGKNPVLIFDEPSANLDPIAENEMIDKINHIAEGRAVIMVTHNMVYTKNVDMIYFFEDGRIVESGSPEELMMKKGHYEKMLREQMERMGKKDEA